MWDKHAKVYHDYVGDEGDGNRRFNSDLFLWKYLGNVEGKTILDAGCGTGYLVRKLIAKKAKRVIGIDFSPQMLQFKRHGFTVEDFDEPVVSDPPPPEFGDGNILKERMRPHSVIFLLRK